MIAKHRTFESSTKSWDDLCNEATAFPTEIGRERLISISLAASGDPRRSGWAESD